MIQWFHNLFSNKKTRKQRHAQERDALRHMHASYLKNVHQMQQELLLEIPEILAPVCKHLDQQITSLAKKPHPTETLHSRKKLSKEIIILKQYFNLLMRKQQLLKTYTLKLELKNLNEAYEAHFLLLKKKVGEPIPVSINQSLLPFESIRRTLPALMSIPLLSDLSRHLEQLQQYKATLENGLHYLQDHLTHATSSSAHSEASSRAEPSSPPSPVAQTPQAYSVSYAAQYIVFLMQYFKNYIIQCLRNCFTAAPVLQKNNIQSPTIISLNTQQKQFTPYLESRLKRWVTEAREHSQKQKTLPQHVPLVSLASK